MAVAFVQGKINGSAAGTSGTVTLGAAPTSGNLLVCWIEHAAAGRPTGTPSGTGWSTVANDSISGATARASAFWWKIAGAGESATITYTAVALTGPVSMVVAEYSGVATTGTFNMAAPAMAAPSSGTAYSLAATPSAATSSLVVAWAADRATASTTAWSGHTWAGSATGVTARVNNNLNNQAGTSGYGTVWDWIGTVSVAATTAAVTAPVSDAGHIWVAIFNAASGGGGSTGTWAPSAGVPRRSLRRVPTFRTNSGTDVPDGNQLLPASLRRGYTRVRRKPPVPERGGAVFSPPDVMEALPGTRRKVRRVPRLTVDGDAFSPPFDTPAAPPPTNPGITQLTDTGKLPRWLVSRRGRTAPQPVPAQQAAPVNNPAITQMVTRGRVGARALRRLLPQIRVFPGLGAPGPSTAYASVVAADAPSYWWRLQETSGPILYDCISGFDLTVSGSGITYGSASLENDVSAKSVLWNNSTLTYAEAPEFPGFNSFSVECLLKETSQNGNLRIIECGGDTTWSLYVEGNVLKFNVFGHGVATLPWTGDTQIHHVVGTYDSVTGFVRLYRDGAKVGEQITGGAGGSIGSNTLRMAGKPGGSAASDGWNGNLAEVAIYPRVLTADDVARHAAVLGLAPWLASWKLRRSLPRQARPRVAAATPVQAVVPPSNPAVTQTTGVRGRLSARVLRRSEVAPAQAVAPGNPAVTQAGRGKALRFRPIRRSEIATVTSTQTVAPVNPSITQMVGVQGKALRFRSLRRPGLANPLPATTTSSGVVTLRQAGAVAEVSAALSVAPAVPAATVTGDLMILGVSAGSAISLPSGWSFLPGTSAEVTADGSHILAAYKVAGASESAPTVSQGTSGRLSAQIVSYYNFDAVTPFAVNAVTAATPASSAPASITVGPTASAPVGGMAITVGGIDSATASSLGTPSGYTSEGLSGGTGKRYGFADKSLSSSGTVSATWTQSGGTLGMTAILSVIKPGAVVTPSINFFGVIAQVRSRRVTPPARRGRIVAVVPAQVAAPANPLIVQAGSSRATLGSIRFRWLRRAGTVRNVTPAVQGVPAQVETSRRASSAQGARRRASNVVRPVEVLATPPAVPTLARRTKFTRRGLIALVVPPQITPSVNPNITQTTDVRGRLGGRGLRRPGILNPVPAQQSATPNPKITQTTGVRGRLTPRALRRGQVDKPIPAQVNPPIQANPDVRGRLVWLRPLRRAAVENPTPAQQPLVPNPPITQTVPVRGRLVPRARRVNPVPAQQSAVANPSIIQLIGVRGRANLRAAVRRGTTAATPSAQRTPPPSQPVLKVGRLRVQWRGNRATQEQVVPTQPTVQNPAITQTTDVRGRLGVRALRRSRVANPTPAQQQLVPNPSITQTTGVRGRVLNLRAVRRGSEPVPTRAQVNPPYPVKPSRVVAFRGLRPRGHTGVALPVPGQDAKAAVGPRRPRLLRAVAKYIPRHVGKVFDKITTLGGPIQVSDSSGVVTSTEFAVGTVADHGSSASVTSTENSSPTVTSSEASTGSVTSSGGSTSQVQP